MKNIRDVLIVIGLLICIIILIACVISTAIFYFNNPDMTDLRRLIENPKPAIIAIIAFIMAKILLNKLK